MLSRILEPEVMDTPAEAHDYDSMDHREVNRRFVDDFLAAAKGDLADVQTIRLLDLGTGTAQIPIELCRRAEKIQVTAVDAARHMLDLAQANIATAGLLAQISLEIADAKQLDYPDATFDGIISNSIIHHLPNPLPCLQEAFRVTKPSGILFFRDLLRPVNEAQLAQIVDLYAPAAGLSTAADHQRAMFSDSLHAALTIEEFQNLVGRLKLSSSTLWQTSDRHWTWVARRSYA